MYARLSCCIVVQKHFPTLYASNPRYILFFITLLIQSLIRRNFLADYNKYFINLRYIISFEICTCCLKRDVLHVAGNIRTVSLCSISDVRTKLILVCFSLGELCTSHLLTKKTAHIRSTFYFIVQIDVYIFIKNVSKLLV